MVIAVEAVAARQSLVHKALAAVLREVRTQARADLALVIGAPRLPGEPYVVLACEGGGDGELIAGEPVSLPRELPGRFAALPEFVIRSALRDRLLICGSTLVMQWRHRETSGWLVIAMLDCVKTLSVTTRRARSFARTVRSAYSESALRARQRLCDELERTTRALNEAEAAADSIDDVLGTILHAGRGLLKTSVCYLSVPDSAAEVFTFTKNVGLRTSAFKQLRMAPGQGLGGLTRHERHVVRSLNYSRDFRERDAPVHETEKEGIVSAMCAPLIIEGRVSGLIYAANRRLTAFSHDDASLLEHFAGNVSMLFKRRELERLRQSTVSRNERNRIAHELHNTVVRKLMEIGYRTQVARREGIADFRSHLDVIEKAAEVCLEMLRDSVGDLSREWSGPANPSSRDVIYALKSMQTSTNLKRVFKLDVCGPDRLPLALASGVVRIGLEALHNAERHSQGTTVALELIVADRQLRLIVEDDGCGPDDDQILAMLNSGSHLGLRQIRSIAATHGGSCSFARAMSGGFRLDAVFPL
jgi:signal transduction histidine kinase